LFLSTNSAAWYISLVADIDAYICTMPFHLAWLSKLKKRAAICLITVAALISMFYYMKNAVDLNGTEEEKGKFVT